MKPDMLPLEEAVARVLAEVRPLGIERVPLESGWGRVLVGALHAPFDVPAEAASLMDGYAVRASDVQPREPLRVAYELPAGHAASRPLERGECARIFTGAPLPPGADAVVKQEDCSADGDQIVVAIAVHPGDHVRLLGSDARRGDELIPAGSMLDPGSLSLAASMGHASVEVGRRPTVALLATGDELRAPGEHLQPGAIYESNLTGLGAQAREAGGVPLPLGIAHDDPDAIAGRLRLSCADVHVTSGGASVGDYDFARAVLERLGGRKVFWQVAIRPGKPVLVGVFERGDRPPALFFALPGNPGASALTFDLFVRPAIRRMMGCDTVRRARVQAVLDAPVKKPAPLTQLVRGRLVARGTALHFEPSAQQGSMSITSLRGLAAVAILPPGSDRVEAGAVVEVEPWGAVER